MGPVDRQNQALQFAIPLLMQKKRMEQEDALYQQKLQMAAQEAAQQRKDKENELLRMTHQAKVKWAQEMHKTAYEGGDPEAVRATGEPLRQMGQPVFAQEQPGPSQPGMGVPLQYLAKPQKPEKQGMTEADLTQRALAGDPTAQAILDAMAKRKLQTAKAGATSVDVRNMGSIPPGYRVEYDQSGNPVSMAPIPGGPAEREIADKNLDREQAAAEASKKEQERHKAVARAGGTVVQDLQRALDVTSKNRLAVGAPAAVMRKIWETDARAVEGFVQSALSNVGLDTLQRMRENSPTGGALGQVPIQQQQRLEQVLGSLDITQAPHIVEDNIKRVINIYMDLIHGSPEEVADLVRKGNISTARAQEVMRRHELSFDEFGHKRSKNSAPPVGTVEGGYLYLGGDPSKEENWKEIR
jgi:hypothetical protein